MAGAVAQMKDAKKARGERGERKPMFSQKSRFAGPTSKLTIHVREAEAKDGKKSFKVYALLEKKGEEKKQRGAVATYGTQAEATKRYDELVAQAKTAGWQLAGTVSKSAFDVIPAAD